ncbi:MAG: fumarylacetoacetate hydrolase family protein [Rhizobiales bacterium]|nr:fumarylacetoacetate hydrolase family protein [Hyphomicrobiales bacterium]NRB13568.1 fumarylacetoacetate hydrolase family protein [Hyphomicrobiales bacterium]
MNHISLQPNQQAITPNKIICVGRNYVAHIEELGNEITQAIAENMVLFGKPNSAIGLDLNAKHGGLDGEDLHYEAELCFLVKNHKFVAIAIGLDLTKRNLQTKLRNKGLPWERSKAFDGSALFSDFVPLSNISDELNFSLEIDGKTRQQGDVGLMIYKPQQILAEITKFCSLQDGDIVMTGTPSGVGLVNSGKKFEAKLYDGDQLLVSQRWSVK